MEHVEERIAARPGLPVLGLPHHRAYIVTDLARATADWHRLTGIGPFIVVPHVQFDELTVCGAPSTLDHTAAFAAFGTEFIELQVIHGISPQARAAHGADADAAGTTLHHMAFAVSDPGRVSAQLTAAGAPRTVTASGGGLDVVLHDARQFTVPASRFTGTRIFPGLLRRGEIRGQALGRARADGVLRRVKSPGGTEVCMPCDLRRRPGPAASSNRAPVEQPQPL
jgi:hypothetical protein